MPAFAFCLVVIEFAATFPEIPRAQERCWALLETVFDHDRRRMCADRTCDAQLAFGLGKRLHSLSRQPDLSHATSQLSEIDRLCPFAWPLDAIESAVLVGVGGCLYFYLLPLLLAWLLGPAPPRAPLVPSCAA